MSDQELLNLVTINKLKVEPCPRKEYDGYLKSGKNRLAEPPIARAIRCKETDF
jgi:hypothetical protein